MNQDFIDSIKQRWHEVFGSPVLDAPKGCMLARSDIPKMLELFEDQEKRFEMLGTCLSAVLAKNGGYVDMPVKVIKTLIDRYKTAGRNYVLTAVSIDEIPGDMVRISLKHEKIITKEDIEVPVTTSQQPFPPEAGPSRQVISSPVRGPSFVPTPQQKPTDRPEVGP